MGHQGVCTDCEATTDIDSCTVCKKPVCPRHRSGTGRLTDGYQCLERACWHVGYPPRLRAPGPSENAMRWFDGKFDVERETVEVCCCFCGGVGEMTRDTYLVHSWPTAPAWYQPPEGWAVVCTPTSEMLVRCAACRPNPPLHIVHQHHLRRGPHLTVDELRGVVFDLPETPEPALRHARECEICRNTVDRERLENPILQAEREEGTLPSAQAHERAVCQLFTNALKLTYPGRKIAVTPAPFSDDMPQEITAQLDGSGVVDVSIGPLERNPAWTAFRCNLQHHVWRREWSSAVRILLEKARDELGRWRASPEEVLREAARRANWDAQQGPDHLRTGRFTPGNDPSA